MDNLVRQLKTTDTTQLHSVYYSWSEEEFHQARIFSSFSEVESELKKGRLWGYFHQTRLVCFVNIFEGIAWEILLVLTHRDHQGVGSAQSLLMHLIQAAHQKGVSEIWLEVSPENPKALGLYKKIGFREQGMRAGYYRDGSDALNMCYFVHHRHEI